MFSWCVCVHACVFSCVCASRRLMLVVFLNCSLSYISRQHLTLEPRACWVNCSSKPAYFGAPLSPVPVHQAYRKTFMCMTEDLNSRTPAWVTSPLPTEMSPQSIPCHLLIALFQYFHIGSTYILDGTHSHCSTDHFTLWFPDLHSWIIWRMWQKCRCQRISSGILSSLTGSDMGPVPRLLGGSEI